MNYLTGLNAVRPPVVFYFYPPTHAFVRLTLPDFALHSHLYDLLRRSLRHIPTCETYFAGVCVTFSLVALFFHGFASLLPSKKEAP